MFALSSITYQSLELLMKKEDISRGSGGTPPHTHTHSPPTSHPLKILIVETKICAICSILEANLKKTSTLIFVMIISFLPLICIQRSIILIFLEKSMLGFFLFFFWGGGGHGKYFVPRFLIFMSTKILVSARNSRLCQPSNGTLHRE